MTTIACEIQRFTRLGATWWNPEGPMRPLHVVNALRLQIVSELIAQHCKRDITPIAADGVRILDVGCGGGLRVPGHQRQLHGCFRTRPGLTLHAKLEPNPGVHPRLANTAWQAAAHSPAP